MLSVAIVEDNDAEAANLASLLKRYAEETGESFRTERFKDGLSIVDGYKANYDIVFLDIEMPLTNGMTAADVIRRTDEEVAIVFVTHLVQFAIQGYEVRASGYFLKPTRYFDLKLCLDRIRRQKATSEKAVLIPYLGSVKRFLISNIKYIESDAHTVTFHNVDGKFSFRGKSMRELESELKGEGFSRCNSGYIVNLRWCEGINGNSVTVGGEEIQISRARKKQFLEDLASSFRR